MPRGDGTGPAGMGPMTGRGAGYCAGYSVPGYMNQIPGRGFWGSSRGFGGGRGRRNMYFATGFTGWQRAAYGYPYGVGAAPYAAPFTPNITQQQELDALKQQAEYFDDALSGVNQRIKELSEEISKKGIRDNKN